ncbi:MAG: hypothetical protein JST42_13960 [Bacteroidetes bacterium]|nr:hypothetical protein [Bacteroidota bacterium]
MSSYLDFNDLRNEGITHLGNLTGKLWTDYNVHDPGITILEALCYALLDLDYRTRLPAADIFARNPAETGADDNFYSPAQILACNPLTIVDYRKLLSDIEGVRNAWLEVALDQPDNCLPQGRKPGNLNGLYHVYIETEDGADEAAVVAAVKTAMHTHRNLCEDLADIVILGKLPLGVYAIIELATDADAVQVYLDMMTTLGNFLSPSPHFYTLQELLDKGLPVDGIFAGRPYSTSVSHGFINTDELQQIQLKKEIHLSDLYKALFDVAGIKTIRDLQWKPCGSAPRSGWKFNIPENNVIDFNVECCSLQFMRNGKPVPFDPAQYTALLAAAAKKNLYSSLLPNLDLPFPKGNYRADLGDYYSIQNDFPFAYGISREGVPADAPKARQAWALQLKGFLLFFDQLLADYLAQLANIRGLFSMGRGGGSSYFLNYLDNGDDPDGPNYVPDVAKLWGNYVDNDLKNLLGSAGTTLAFPAAPGQTAAPEDILAMDFTNWDDMQNAITLLKSDLAGSRSVVNVLQYQDCFYYTISTTASDMVLVSKRTFANASDAQKHAAYVTGNGMGDALYSLFSIAGDKFTFSIDYKTVDLKTVLQGELEDPALYAKRRKYFLDHLLSRFAERFTDYALLQYTPGDIISAEENYLSNYAILSSQRGQARGFEQKWKGLVGAPIESNRSLCNFIVRKTDAQYTFSLKIGGKTFFSPPDLYSSEDAARQAATALMKAMADRSNYTVSPEGMITVRNANLVDKYPTEEYANTIADRLSALFGQRPSQRDVFASAFVQKTRLIDYSKRASTRSADTLYRNTLATDIEQYIDLDAFKVDINDTIVDRPDRFTYALLPASNSFKFEAVDDFDSRDAAMTHAKELLLLATIPANYYVEEDRTGTCTIWITGGGRKQAGYATRQPKPESDKLAEKIQDLVRRQLFTVQTGNEPSRWKFHFFLGYEDAGRITLDSRADFESPAAAMDALRALWTRPDDLLNVAAPPEHAPAPEGASAPTEPPAPPFPEAPSPEAIAAGLQFYKSIQKAISSDNPADYADVHPDPMSKQGQYSWLCVDVDQRVAIVAQDYPDPSATDQAMERLSDLLTQGVKYLEICVDGRITRKRRDPATGVFGYHWLIKSHNYYYSSGKQLILFESVKGYPSEDEAKQSFAVAYLELLEQAAQESSYGPLISLTEIFGNDPPAGPVVFIPKETKVSLGGADADVIARLVAIAGAYPIKRSGDTFYCSLTIPDTTPFVLKCACQHKTIAAAQLDFAYLIRLLRAPINLFTERNRIYIAEVLAESPGRYMSEDDAWKGVDGFIAALRIEGSIVKYRKADCSNTFLVVGAKPTLQHPYTYSTPGQRDAAIGQLTGQTGTQSVTQDADGRWHIAIDLPDLPEAWVGTDTYDSQDHAQAALNEVLPLLSDAANYLPAFTCDCRTFEIFLLDPTTISAVHPQSYNAREPVVAAVQRMEKAVNTEGLHLIEHILLRHQPTADCGCLSVAYCSAPPACSYDWTLPPTDPDPCAPAVSSSFIPGNDPWSFIATVALPAWPGKFYPQDNKLVLENALYREAPAHVLLRVVWLDPRDCHLFETKYKGWRHQENGCDFLQYLFSTRWDALPAFSEQVSELYCWPPQQNQ